jgi:hypothetical protein
VSTPLHKTEIHVLALAQNSDAHWLLTGFSPADGRITALLRQSRKSNTNIKLTPDLFDRLELALAHGRQGPSAGPWFVQDVQLLQRHPALGRDYVTLTAASRLARFVARNSFAPEASAAIHTLLSMAFAALARPATRPELVLLKGLYCIARDEGLPLKQQWVPTLAGYDQQHLATALRLASDDPVAPSGFELGPLVASLADYLTREHDLRLD